MDLFGAFDGFSIDARWMFGRYSIDAPFPALYLPFPISYFLFHMFMSLFDRPLPISHCRWLGLTDCAERLNTASPLRAQLRWRHEAETAALREDRPGGTCGSIRRCRAFRGAVFPLPFPSRLFCYICFIFWYIFVHCLIFSGRIFTGHFFNTPHLQYGSGQGQIYNDEEIRRFGQVMNTNGNANAANNSSKRDDDNLSDPLLRNKAALSSTLLRSKPKTTKSSSSRPRRPSS